MMKKVALFLADGFEEIEALGTVDVLRRAKIEVDTISITNKKEVQGAHGIAVLADKTFDEIDFLQYETIVLPGGMPGAKNLNEHAELKKQIVEFVDKKKNVAAICAAPLVLGGLRLLDGKEATCYPGFEPELIGAKITNDSVTVADNITTGKGPGFVFDFALQLVESIAGKATRNEVEKGLLLAK